MNIPAVIELPLSSIENMKMELAWRHEDLIRQVQKIRTDLNYILATLNPEKPKTTDDLIPFAPLESTVENMTTRALNDFLNEEELTSPPELSRLLLSPDMLPFVISTFENEPMPTALLRYYHTLSVDVKRLREDFLRHATERDNIFKLLIENSTFHEEIEPILLEYC